MKLTDILLTRKTALSGACALACSLLLAACTGTAPESPDEPAPQVLADVAQLELEGETKPLAAVAGPFRTPPLGQRTVRFYATDLGWTFTHDGQLWVMFGDSWRSRLGTPLSQDSDDALGTISLRDFPDGDSVDRWVAAHPPARGNPFWQAAAPPIRLVTDIWRRVEPLVQILNGKSLTSAAGLTPIAGFSNARTDNASAAFGLFLRNEPVQCSATGTCADGFDCDAQLGRCAPVTDLSSACVLGTTSCRCVPIGQKTGLCQDRGSSLYDGSSERGRSNAVVMRQQVGSSVRCQSFKFTTQPSDTHRFFNATARTVNDFDASRAHGQGNDYVAADGRDFAGEGVFLWGRPNFGGVGAQGRDAQLYLAWVPMPVYDPAGAFPWKPQFFAGLDADGRPMFTARELDSVPLDLDAAAPGEQPEEVHDLVGQMSISWVPSIKRFVMLYGGDVGTQFLHLIFGTDGKLLVRDPLGSIYIRYAEQPWGPWTAPKPVLIAGAPEHGIMGQYGPGGILFDGSCNQRGCVKGEPVFANLPNERGRLYGPNIIEPWTEPRENGAIDLYWHVSTWNPYQVVLMKTRLQQPPP